MSKGPIPNIPSIPGCDERNDTRRIRVCSIPDIAGYVEGLYATFPTYRVPVILTYPTYPACPGISGGAVHITHLGGFRVSLTGTPNLHGYLKSLVPGRPVMPGIPRWHMWYTRYAQEYVKARNRHTCHTRHSLHTLVPKSRTQQFRMDV